jgi:hypothetical protein
MMTDKIHEASKEYIEKNSYGDSVVDAEKRASFNSGAYWAYMHPYWFSVDEALPKRSEINPNISEPAITLSYYDDGPHFYVEINRYHFIERRWLNSQARYWMPFEFPPKGGKA